MMLLADRLVFAENVHITLLLKNWLEDEEKAQNVEIEAYLSILSTLGKSN